MSWFVKVAAMTSLFLVVGAAGADAGNSITVPLPITTQDVAAMVPSGARTIEFLAGVIAGILLGEFARVAWRWCTTVWTASLNWGTHALRYGSVAALLVALIFLI